MDTDFWNKAEIAVFGGGNWGSVLAHLASQNCAQVRIWVRDEERARVINSTRNNPDYVSHLQFNERVKAFTDIARVIKNEGGKQVNAVVWALPSTVCREEAKRLAKMFQGDELIIHAVKGIEKETMRRISQILMEELPCPRIGVLSGPNLAEEISRGEPAATVIASHFDEVIEAGKSIFSSAKFRVYGSQDVVGVEWCGTLKNILAIASGALDALGLGHNTRAMLLTRGLAEMVRFGLTFNAKPETFLGLAGMGDLLATCSSPLSRNYRVGFKLAKGEKLENVLKELGSTAEGVQTAQSVYTYAKSRSIDLPITEGVVKLLGGQLSVGEVLESLMRRPLIEETTWS